MKKRIFILILGLFFLVGCGGNTTTLYTQETTTTETESYLVQFLGFDGAVLSVQVVEEGDEAIAPVAPVVPGYQFIGWVEDFSDVTSNLIITSNYQITQVTITFDSQGGSLVNSISLNYGSAIALTTPLRDGYNFMGWFLGREINSPRIYDGDKVYQNQTLIARWQRMTSTTVYNEEQLLTALGVEICEEIHLGADIEISETIDITRNLSIYGDGYKLIPLGEGPTFEIIQEVMSSPKKIEEVEKTVFSIYDLEFVYDLDDFTVPSVFNLYEVQYYDIRLDNVTISGDIQDVFTVDYSYRTNITVTNSEIKILGKAFDIFETFELNLLVEECDIEAGTILFFTEVIYSKILIKDSDLTMITSNQEEHLALFVFEATGDNDISIEDSYIDTMTLSVSYVAFSANEQENQMIGFDGSTIEVNCVVFEDLFSKTSFLTHYTFNGSTIVIKEGISEIPAYGFSHAGYFSNIILPSTLESIGEFAFEYCQGLDSVIIPDGVRTIGEGAFSFCSDLVNAVIPNSVIWMGSNVFINNHDELQIYVFEDVVTTHWQFDWNALVYEEINDVRHLGTIDGMTYLVFADETATIIDYIYEGLSEVVIPETVEVEGMEYVVTKIGKFAFADNSTLESITIPSTVIIIDFGAFSDNLILETVNFALDSTLEFIGNEAFMYCLSLKDITIPSSVTFLGDYIFYNDYRLETVTFETGSALTAIPANAFAWNDRLVSITIPSSVTSIEDEAFFYCFNLVEVIFEDESVLEYIGTGAFYHASNLASFNLPASVEYIGFNAFYETYGLVNFIIPNESVLTTIDNSAFQYSGVSQITLPESVTFIGASAFSYCQNLTEINIPSLVTEINGFAFYENHALATVTFSPESNLDLVGYNAFYNNYALSEIALPETVTFIGSYAFYNCYSLSEFNVPSSLQTIDAYAFSECDGLVSVNYGEVISLTTIFQGAFSNCFSLIEFFIPDTVTYVGGDVFAYSFNTIILVEAVSAPESWAYNWDGNSSCSIYYAVNHRTITLELNNEQPAIEIFEKMGTVLTTPPTPERIGYTFDGWFEDDVTFLVSYTFTVMPEEDITIYAKWLEMP